MENKFERKCTFLIDDHYITEIVRSSTDINETKLEFTSMTHTYMGYTHTEFLFYY